MSTKSQKKIDVVDRVRIGWIVNLILNHKTQEEVAKDIADGILDLEEIEEMFPWRYVEELRRGYAESTQNFLYRFTQISDDRMKIILDKFLRQKSRSEIIKLISDYALKLDKLQVSYLWKYVTESKESVDSEATSSTSCLTNSPNKNIIVVESKETSSTKTEKKQITKRGDKKETKKSEKKETKKSDEEEREKSEKKETKKSEKKETKKSDEEEKEKKVEKMKKVRVVTKKLVDKLKSVKRVEDGNVDDRNKVEEAIEENVSAKGDHGCVEKASIDHGVSTNQGSHQEGSKELSVTRQEDRSKDGKSTGVKKKIIKKVSKKDTKASMEKINERDSKEMNFPIEGTSSTNEEQRVEEMNKSENNENVIEKEEASFAKTNDRNISLETRNDEGFEDSSQKSRSNETINVSSLIGEELEICSNQNQEDRDVEEHDLNIQFDTSTPKKFDNDGNIIQIKEEPEDERSFNEIDYSINNDLEKDADSEKNLNKTSRVTDDDEEVSNLNDRVKSIVVKLENDTRSPKIPEPGKHNPRKMEAQEKVKQSKYKKQNDRSVERQRQNRQKRMKEEELRKCEKKIRNTMEGLKDQINKLVKDIRYLGENRSSSSSTDDSSEKESSSSSNDYTSEEESSCSSDDYYTTEEESSYDTSSESSSNLSLSSSEKCYCSSCVSSNSDSSTNSDSNSEYTICSCSTHYNSTDSDP